MGSHLLQKSGCTKRCTVFDCPDAVVDGNSRSAGLNKCPGCGGKGRRGRCRSCVSVRRGTEAFSREREANGQHSREALQQ